MSDTDFVVTITDDTSTVTLTSSPFGISGFDPRSGHLDEPEVDHKVQVRVMDGSAPNNLAEARTLRRLLVQARDHWNDRRQARVYITFKESASADQYRSPIKPKSKADWDDNLLRLANWRGNTQYLDLNIHRLNYWEGPEAQIPLTNDNGTDNTTGLNVYNVNDGSGASPNKRVNWVDIDAANVDGDINGATRLEITNTFATNRLDQLWIGQNWDNPSTFDHWLEVEDATHTGSLITDAAFSGGYGIADGIPYASELEVFKWSLNSAYLDAANGGYFKALLRFGDTAPYLDVRYRLKIQFGLTDLWETGYLTMDSNYAIKIRDLATFQLPPWLPGMDNLEALDFILAAYQTLDGGVINERWDALQITPVDGWRAYKSLGYGANQNSRIVDDGINNRLYQDDIVGGHKLGNWIGYGRPIQLKPATNQRLYFQMHGNIANSASVDMSISVKLYYRPRRHSL